MIFRCHVRLRAAFAALVLGLVAVQALAGEREIEALERFFSAETIDPDQFAQSFLDQVPLPRLQPARDQLVAPLGDFLRAEQEGENYRAVFEQGHVPVSITLDAAGQIIGLFLRPPVLSTASADDAIGRLREQGGEVSLLVRRDGAVIHALAADQPLAVGSAFKLSVLAALLDEIDSASRSWSDVHRLSDQDRSLPSGELRRWPEGAVLTLYSLAARMISQSDNTATDALIHALGRERVGAHAPPRNRPFLTTREAFVLKDPARPDLAAAFLAADADTRAGQVVDLAAEPLPDVAAFMSGEMIEPRIEWFYTVEELCDLMAQVGEHPVSGINVGGLPSADRWQRVAFKGGSEPGVINLTYGLVDGQGRQWCVSATRNDDQPFSESAFVSAVHAVVDQLPGE